MEGGPLNPGQTFMSYEIGPLIGHGGHAWVYQAFHRFMRRDVAIKVLRSKEDINKDRLRRGQVEAQIESRIRHPNIVEVFDAGLTDDGLFYIVMELLRGRSLHDALTSRGRLDVDEALRLAIQIAEGMQAAHDQGIIHRDLKPANIFLMAQNQLKIIDFGIAKVLDTAGFTTEKDMVLGTLYYMSPEQIQARPLTPRTDVFSLGVILYEALAGEHPIQPLLTDTEPSFFEVSRAVVTKQPARLDAMYPHVPRPVAALVHQAMAKVAEQRFSSMNELIGACRECLDGLKNAHLRPRDLSRASLDPYPVSRPPMDQPMWVQSDATDVRSRPQFTMTAALPPAPEIAPTGFESTLALEREPMPPSVATRTFGDAPRPLSSRGRNPYSSGAVVPVRRLRGVLPLALIALAIAGVAVGLFVLRRPDAPAARETTAALAAAAPSEAPPVASEAPPVASEAPAPEVFPARDWANLPPTDPVEPSVASAPPALVRPRTSIKPTARPASSSAVESDKMQERLDRVEADLKAHKAAPGQP